MDDLSDDTMIVVAALVSRSEALVTASMLEVAGILVHVGGAWHASAEVNSLALGGHRLWIPSYQQEQASAILLEVLGDDEWSFSYGLRQSVLRFLAISVGVFVLAWAGWSFALAGRLVYEPWPLLFTAAIIPVNPQGRGDYYLRGADGRTYCA